MSKNNSDNEIEIMSSSPDDPRLKKKWGYITALPSEFLIHFQKGRLNEKKCGQGASCFKRLRDTVFIIPTSLKEISFQAGQLTKDNVDVRIKGMAVYRISDPMKIYKLINFSNRQHAEEKLARMIGDMCRSTSKWLVSNMGVEECMRKRKEEIALALHREVTTIIADAEKGWGVEIFTIDIQDVYIQDDELFRSLQMLYKNDKLKESEQAQLDLERNLELKRLEIEQSLAEHRKRNELDKAQIEAEIRNEQIRLARQNEENQAGLDKFRVEENESIENYKLEQQLERQRKQMSFQLEKTKNDVAANQLRHQEELDALQKRISIENEATSAGIEKGFFERGLPAAVEMMAKSMNNANVTVIHQDEKGGGLPFNYVLTEALKLLKSRQE